MKLEEFALRERNFCLQGRRLQGHQYVINTKLWITRPWSASYASHIQEPKMAIPDVVQTTVTIDKESTLKEHVIPAQKDKDHQLTKENA